jgi:hypothetical protein
MRDEGGVRGRQAQSEHRRARIEAGLERGEHGELGLGRLVAALGVLGDALGALAD